MSARSPITTHILDTARGRPARGVRVRLEREGERREGDRGFVELAQGVTDDDGRVTDLLEPGSLQSGVHRISFDTGAYHEGHGERSFYPSVSIVFTVDATDEHYHVPLLLSPHGFTTYRGS